MPGRSVGWSLAALAAVAIALCAWRQSSAWSASPFGLENVEITITAVPTGDPYAVRLCARALSDGKPWKGMKIDFTIPEGPHKGQKLTGYTDSNGEVCWTLFSDGRLGTDTVVATCERVSTETKVMWKQTYAQLSLAKPQQRGCPSCRSGRDPRAALGVGQQER